MSAALEYYTLQSEITELGGHVARFDGLPADLPALHRIVQNLYVHVWKVRRDHPEWLEGRTHEIESRRVARSLALAFARDPAPVTTARAPANKLIVDCRHHAVLLCALLRHYRVPARVRCGFAAYLAESHHQDHWVAEYWDAARGCWVLEDADLVRHDVPRTEFLTAGVAWQAARAGQADPMQFGYGPDPGARGEWALRLNVTRDLAALNKFEGLSGDIWGLMEKDEPAVTAYDRALLDEAATWSLAGNDQFERMRAFYKATPLLRVPRTIKSYNYLSDTLAEVALDAGG